MNGQCNDPETGALLHAWELGALSEEDVKRFETHLLGCHECYEKAKEFASKAALLRQDKSVQDEVNHAASATDARSTVAQRLRQSLWPDIPVLLRPAITLLVIVLMIYPAWMGLRRPGNPKIEAVTPVYFDPARGLETPQFSMDRDLIVTFFHSLRHAGMPYEFQIVDSQGVTVVQHATELRLSAYGTGTLLLEAGCLMPGAHTLVVTVSGDESERSSVEFKFEVLALN